MRPDGRNDVVGVLTAEWQRNAHRVRRLHQKLFYRPLLSAVARLPLDAGGDVGRLSEEAAKARMTALGWVSPEGALNHLRALTSGLSRAASIQTTLLPVLLDELARTPDPDRGLLAYRRVSEALATTPWYLRLLRDEGQVAARLMHLLGTSALVPDLLVRAPEVLRLLASPTAGHSDELTRDPAERGLLVAHVRRTAARTGRRRGHRPVHAPPRDAARRVRRPAGRPAHPGRVPRRCRRCGWRCCRPPSTPSNAPSPRGWHCGSTPAARIAVIGMGRLGGAELGYGSDADVLFVCEPVEGAGRAGGRASYATTVAESVRRSLGASSPDPALVVDADLRPEGRNGPLVRTLESYRAYYARWAEIVGGAGPAAGPPRRGRRRSSVGGSSR